jgi:hypothetical protein
MIAWILILTLFTAADDRPVEAGRPAKAGAASQQVASTQPSFWDVYRTQQFAVAIPRNWRPQKANSPAILLYLMREGRDETGEPLKVGLTIERFPGNKDTLGQGVTQLIDHFRADKRWVPQGEIRDEPITLADGTPARLVSLNVLSQDGARRAIQYKLMTLDKEQVGIVIGGFLTTSAGSKITSPGSKMAQLLRAHVTSLTLDPSKMDEAPLRAAYVSQAPAASQPATQPAK